MGCSSAETATPAPLEVCYAVNEGFVQHLCVSLVSLLTAHPGRPCRVHVLHDGIGAEARANLEACATGPDCTLELRAVEEQRFAGLLTGAHFSLANYYRLLIPELLADVERILYLDADAVVLGDLGGVYDEGCGPFALAAVEDPLAIHRLRELAPEAGYFNSGVMLIDATRWRTSRLGQRALGFAEHHPDQILWVDQCALNAVLEGAWRHLPLRFNSQSAFFARRNHPRLAGLPGIAEALRDPAVVHFTSHSKPWQFMNCHPLRHHYWRFLERTPYAGYREPDRSVWNYLRRLLRRRKYSATPPSWCDGGEGRSRSRTRSPRRAPPRP